MQIGVRTLASKLGQTGLQKLVAMGAIPAQRLCTKRAFTATIGMSNAELVKNRAALGKKNGISGKTQYVRRHHDAQ